MVNRVLSWAGVLFSEGICPAKFFLAPSMHRKSQDSFGPPASSQLLKKHLPDDTVEAVLEPLDGLVLVDLVVDTDGGLAAAALGNTLTGTGPKENQVSIVVCLN